MFVVLFGNLVGLCVDFLVYGVSWLFRLTPYGERKERKKDSGCCYKKNFKKIRFIFYFEVKLGVDNRFIGCL